MTQPTGPAADLDLSLFLDAKFEKGQHAAVRKGDASLGDVFAHALPPAVYRHFKLAARERERAEDCVKDDLTGLDPIRLRFQRWSVFLSVFILAPDDLRFLPS